MSSRHKSTISVTSVAVKIYKMKTLIALVLLMLATAVESGRHEIFGELLSRERGADFCYESPGVKSV